MIKSHKESSLTKKWSWKLRIEGKCKFHKNVEIKQTLKHLLKIVTLNQPMNESKKLQWKLENKMECKQKHNVSKLIYVVKHCSEGNL